MGPKIYLSAIGLFSFRRRDLSHEQFTQFEGTSPGDLSHEFKSQGLVPSCVPILIFSRLVSAHFSVLFKVTYFGSLRQFSLPCSKITFVP